MEGGICKRDGLGAQHIQRHPLVTVITAVIIDGEEDDIHYFTICKCSRQGQGKKLDIILHL